MKCKCLFLCVYFLLSSCEEATHTTSQGEVLTNPVENFKQTILDGDTIHTEYLSKQIPITYFKIGRFLNSNILSSILLNSPTDSTYNIELYKWEDNSWTKTNKITMFSNSVQFDIDFRDFNFDGIRDVFIQTSVSNGLAISRGEVFLFDNKTGMISKNEELSRLGNLNTDNSTRLITSESAKYCQNQRRILASSSYKWIGDSLKKVGD